MKKIILFVVLFIGMITATFGQLSTESKVIKEKLPEVYGEIKYMAVQKWDDDHEMIVYTINGQCESYFEMLTAMEKSNYSPSIMTKAMVKWKSTKGYDWEMVMYEYKNQLEASSQY